MSNRTVVIFLGLVILACQKESIRKYFPGLPNTVPFPVNLVSGIDSFKLRTVNLKN